MLVEAVNGPIRYRWPGGEIRLVPGKPVELPNDRAERLLAKAGGKVRQITTTAPPVIVEPHPSPRRCYWEDRDGTIRPGVVTMLGQCGEEFWVLVEDGTSWVWVTDFRLRSRAQWESQQRTMATKNERGPQPAQKILRVPYA
ncbi:MAG: hypothetical protein E8D45_07835 [Nitrospira sp.]|nr:MAG: hypothetical protein E8D45_07835 [Nitrospira sp.]